MLTGKTICITGGTGSLGGSILKELLPLNPKKIIIFSRDEYKQYQMKQKYSGENLRYFIGDVRDIERLKIALADVDYVIHTAALKQQDVSIYNTEEVIKTNVNGTMNVVNAAIYCGVKRLINISSDKAAFPISVYGATKLTGESIVNSGSVYSGGKLSTTNIRFGNLIGSRGSFIEKLWEYKKKGIKTVPLVDVGMIRYWISLPDAAKFVINNINNKTHLLIPKMYKLAVREVALWIIPDCTFYTIRREGVEKLSEDISNDGLDYTIRHKPIPEGYFDEKSI